MYEPSWLRALTEIGCKAELFDCHEYTLPGTAGRIERRLLIGPGIRRLRRALIDRVNHSRPDIVLIYQGHYIDRDTVDSVKRVSFVVGYHNDDPFGPGARMLRYRHFRRALASYQGFHVYREVNVTEALAVGVPHSAVLMPAYMPWMDYPRDLTAADRQTLQSDLFFAGHCEPDERSACLLAALECGLRIKIHGDATSWGLFAPPELLSRIAPISHIVSDEYRRAISAARLCACFFSKKNRDQYTRRVFEITACGGFLFSERTAAMLELLPEGTSAEYFSGPDEFADKAKFYSTNEIARQRIAARGYETVTRSGHDIFSRMRQWLLDVETWRNSSTGPATLDRNGPKFDDLPSTPTTQRNGQHA